MTKSLTSVLAAPSVNQRRIYTVLLSVSGRVWTVAGIAGFLPEVPVNELRSTLHLLLGDGLMEIMTGTEHRCLALRLTDSGKQMLAGIVSGRADATTRMLVAVVGRPGSGKSTVVASLADRYAVPVFRLREVIRAYPEVLAGLAPMRDVLGWVGLAAVRRALRVAFVDGRLPFDTAVLLDNFPGTAGQLDVLGEVAAEIGARVALLELDTRAATVIQRVARRRVCRTCGGDSHAPASPSAEDPSRCASCGEPLSRRESDEPRMHGLRLARYDANLPQITQVAAQRGIAHVRVPADGEASAVHRRACRSFESVLNHAVSLSADRRSRS